MHFHRRRVLTIRDAWLRVDQGLWIPWRGPWDLVESEAQNEVRIEMGGAKAAQEEQEELRLFRKQEGGGEKMEHKRESLPQVGNIRTVLVGSDSG